jgi:hypothetical protein
MKHRILVFALAAAALCASAIGQTAANNNDWVGIWHANADGQPTGAMTLATDTGTLGGTLVLDIVSPEGGHAHVVAQEPHVLINPKIDDKSLSFDVKMHMRDGSVVTASFVVKRTSANKAAIHCVSCGPAAPVVEMEKDQ